MNSHSSDVGNAQLSFMSNGRVSICETLRVAIPMASWNSSLVVLLHTQTRDRRDGSRHQNHWSRGLMKAILQRSFLLILLLRPTVNPELRPRRR